MANVAKAYQEVARRQQRDELILSHLPLVKHIIGRMAIHFPAGVDIENLEAAGALGLVEAAQHFDPAQNVQFKTFAYMRIRGAILDELRRNSPLPQQMQERIAIIRRASEKLGPPLTVQRLAVATGLTEDEVADALLAMRFNHLLGGEALLEGPPVAESYAPDAPLMEAERRQELARAIERLPLQQRTVVTLYYKEDLRLKEISQVMNLSESRISRLLSAALLTLRGELEPEE
jgi:RNA polymerase sigma factor for flagellar operon FliA